MRPPRSRRAEQVPVEAFLDPTPNRRQRRPSKAKQRRRRRRTIVMLVVLALFAVAVTATVMSLRSMLNLDAVQDYSGPGEGQVTFTVPQGAGPIAIGSALEEEGVVATSKVFLKTLQSDADGRVIQPGQYDLKLKMSSKDAVAALLGTEGGKVHYAAISSNLRQGEALGVLSDATGIARSEFDELAKNPSQFGIPKKAPSLEGYLSPGEYRFPVDVTAKQVIKELVDKRLKELKAAGIADPNEQYRILTIASIIEAEAGKADYSTVAGAIMNRLNGRNQETFGLVQSDATVTYGLNRKSYELTEEEKADKSNPYNTYAREGLPVGPIGSPGEAAIEAAANPKKVPFFYWVTVNLDSGETKFSRTLAEHNRYVAEYRSWCEANAGRCQ